MGHPFRTFVFDLEREAQFAAEKHQAFITTKGTLQAGCTKVGVQKKSGMLPPKYSLSLGGEIVGLNGAVVLRESFNDFSLLPLRTRQA